MTDETQGVEERNKDRLPFEKWQIPARQPVTQQEIEKFVQSDEEKFTPDEDKVGEEAEGTVYLRVPVSVEKMAKIQRGGEIEAAQKEADEAIRNADKVRYEAAMREEEALNQKKMDELSPLHRKRLEEEQAAGRGESVETMPEGGTTSAVVGGGDTAVVGRGRGSVMGE